MPPAVLSTEPVFECPEHVYRHSHDDDKRTRLLKEVLRSTVVRQKKEGKTKGRKMGFAVQGPSPAAARTRGPLKTEPSRVTLQELSECQESDERCLGIMELFDDDDSPCDSPPVSPLLRQCGRRIADLSVRLQDEERALRRAQSETKLAFVSGLGSEGDIRIVDRPDEPPAVVRARNDRIVAEVVAASTTFDKLEAFKDTVERAKGYEGLREAFPQRFKYHPSMFLLNDGVLNDTRKFKAAVWATHDDGERKKSQPPRSVVSLKVSANLDGSALAQRRGVGALRRDRSVPILRL